VNRGEEPHDKSDAFNKACDEYCVAWLKGEDPDLEAYCRRFHSRENEFRVRTEKFIATYRYFKEFGDDQTHAFPEGSEEVENVEGRFWEIFISYGR